MLLLLLFQIYVSNEIKTKFMFLQNVIKVFFVLLNTELHSFSLPDGMKANLIPIALYPPASIHPAHYSCET